MHINSYPIMKSSNRSSRLYPLMSDDENRHILHDAAAGVPVASFFDIAADSGFSIHRLASFLHTSLKTLQRYLKEHRLLDAAAGEHLLRIRNVYELGREVFGSTAAFEQWLEKPSIGLHNQKPIELMPLPGGVQLIHEELLRTAWGYPV